MKMKKLGKISGNKKKINDFVENELIKDEIKKGKNEGTFYIEMDFDDNKDSKKILKELNNKLKELKGILITLNKYNKSYNDLIVDIVYDEDEKYAKVLVEPFSLKIGVNVTSIISKNVKTGEIKKWVPKEEKTNINKNIKENPNIKKALRYLSEVDNNNARIKTYNAFESIEKFFISKYNNVKNEKSFYKKLRDLDISTVKECKKFTKTANANNEDKGRHEKFGNQENIMSDEEMKNFISKILRYLLES